MGSLNRAMDVVLLMVMAVGSMGRSNLKAVGDNPTKRSHPHGKGVHPALKRKGRKR